MLETYGDFVIKVMRFVWSASCWTSPILLTILYRRDAFTVEGLVTAGSYGTTLSFILLAAFLLRGIGRALNPEYISFIRILTAAQHDPSHTNKRALQGYDSEFWAWPVDFRWDHSSDEKTKSRGSVAAPAHTSAVPPTSLLYKILGYMAAKTVGIRMMYPGKTSLIGTLVDPALQMGRAKLVEERGNTTRAKLLTRDGNEIDTMFIDRRHQTAYQQHGNTLVVCCEGNSGFYEIGSCLTPLDAGYSVLGWNHPGFSGSTGVPWPGAEQCAIDVVMQYAITRLGFPPHDIALYAWSIGGYSATWAALTYPDVTHLVLDATFDDVMPLATGRMPQSFKELVEYTVRKYIDLNNAEQLIRYPGPVLLVRRSKDEMITTDGPAVIGSNRANHLLIKLLTHRYPHLLDDSTAPALWDWLARPHHLDSGAGLDKQYCESILSSYAEQHSASFPMLISVDTKEERIKLVLFLASEYMRDFDSTHCVPLPASMYTQPWCLTAQH